MGQRNKKKQKRPKLKQHQRDRKNGESRKNQLNFNIYWQLKYQLKSLYGFFFVPQDVPVSGALYNYKKIKMDRQQNCQPQHKTNENNQHIKQQTEEDDIDPQSLKDQYKKPRTSLIRKKKQNHKNKGTNIPKFLLKIFFQNLPSQLPDAQHTARMHRIQLKHKQSRSKTRFDLKQIFGLSSNTRTARQNQLNRRILKRILSQSTYDNILTQSHIKDKRVYILFCKKMLMRLSKPELLDKLQI